LKTAPEKSLRQRALDYLGKREYSYAELWQKLKPFAEEHDDIPALLEDFKNRGWLSDARSELQGIGLVGRIIERWLNQNYFSSVPLPNQKRA